MTPSYAPTDRLSSSPVRALLPPDAASLAASFTASRLALPTDRRRNPLWRARLVDRARAEFLELPGMYLTLPQAQRLFGLRRDICERVLETLVHEGFLHAPDPGVYTRTRCV